MIVRWKNVRSVVVLAGVLLAVGAGRVQAQEGAALDVSAYPAEQQRQYKVFAEKCSRCHDLSRPLTVKYSEAGWRDNVLRMARKPGANISRREQQQITAFLVFHGRVGRPAATPAAAAGGGGSAPAAAPMSLGKAAQGGVRLEVFARPAQSVLQLANGQWSQVAPQAGENTYLEVRLFDAESGEKLPYATVKARFMSDTGNGSERTLSPAYGAHGFHYGANVTTPTPIRVQVTIEPPALTRVGEGAARWMNPITLEFKVTTE